MGADEDHEVWVMLVSELQAVTRRVCEPDAHGVKAGLCRVILRERAQVSQTPKDDGRVEPVKTFNWKLESFCTFY